MRAGTIRTIRATRIDDGTEHIFHSIHEASRVLGIGRANIYRCLNGEYRQTKGYIFEGYSPLFVDGIPVPSENGILNQGMGVSPQRYNIYNGIKYYDYGLYIKVREDGTGIKWNKSTGRWEEVSLSYLHKGRYIRVDVAYGKPMKWHRICYCAFHGFIPNDFVVHHVDMVGTNNSIDNLVAMDKVSHDELHRLLKLKAKELQ